jgi:hypothetical protein
LSWIADHEWRFGSRRVGFPTNSPGTNALAAPFSDE